tara:strand:- start:3978 stop:4124 length:147 start_codon:yes stop_codon:yes gene_type:complete
MGDIPIEIVGRWNGRGSKVKLIPIIPSTGPPVGFGNPVEGIIIVLIPF